MSRIDLVSILLQIVRSNVSKAEKTLLELKLFDFTYKELSEIFNQKYSDSIHSIPSLQKENAMFKVNFTQEIINDILSTEEYSLMGIAYHTHIPIEVLSDVASGINVNPTFELSRKLFELHMMVRRDLYHKLIKKLLAEYLSKELPPKDNDQ